MQSAVLRPLQRPQALADQVYQALRAQLRSGTIGAGQALQEVPLAAQLGVSRTPVREALARLASEGLLATDQRSFTVPALTLADVDDIYEVRFLLEPAAMRRIAPRTADPRVRAPVEAAVAAAAAAHKAGNAAAFRDANVRYREAWLSLVPNPRLVREIGLYGTLWGLVIVHSIFGMPILTLLFRNYFSSLPEELFKAARVDGAGFWGIYFRIMLPMSLPIFVVAVIMNGSTSYLQKSSSGRITPSCSAMATKGSPSAVMSTAFATMLGTRSLASGMLATWYSPGLRPCAGAMRAFSGSRSA